jgi:hypothetical protein
VQAPLSRPRRIPPDALWPVVQVTRTRRSMPRPALCVVQLPAESCWLIPGSAAGVRALQRSSQHPSSTSGRCGRRSGRCWCCRHSLVIVGAPYLIVVMSSNRRLRHPMHQASR